MLLSICPSEEEELSDDYGLSSNSECYTSRDIMIRIGSRSWGKIREGSHSLIGNYLRKYRLLWSGRHGMRTVLSGSSLELDMTAPHNLP